MLTNNATIDTTTVVMVRMSSNTEVSNLCTISFGGFSLVNTIVASVSLAVGAMGNGVGSFTGTVSNVGELTTPSGGVINNGIGLLEGNASNMGVMWLFVLCVCCGVVVGMIIGSIDKFSLVATLGVRNRRITMSNLTIR